MICTARSLVAGLGRFQCVVKTRIIFQTLCNFPCFVGRRPRNLTLLCLLAACADFGKEEAVSIENMGKSEITKQLEALVQKGESMPR